MKARRRSSALTASAVALVAMSVGGAAASPTVFPGGKGRIVFVSARPIPGQNRLNAGKSDIFSLDLASGRSRDLSHTSADDSSPVSSPDGRQIAFVRRSFSGGSSLWLMRRDGRAQHRLTALNDVAGDITWSPSGVAIAFTTLTPPLDWGLWLVGADGRGLRRLTGFEAHGLRWSPDGTQIAFGGRERQDSSVFSHIGVIGLDGGPVRWLTPPNNEDFSPAWSPDGRRLVFVRAATCACAPENLFVIGADGTGDRQLTPYDTSPGELIPLGAPAWSPRRNEIAFTRGLNGEGEGLGQSVNLINADGTGLHALARNAFAPAWSPTGSRLAFAQVLFGRTRPLGLALVVKPLGRPARRRHLEPWPSELTGEPSWSPDGRKLLYSSVFAGRNDLELFSITPQGHKLRQLTRDKVDDFDPVWSRDGRRIAFARGRLADDLGVKSSSLYLIGADGRRLRRLTRGRADLAPSWAPEGKRIVFSRRGGLAIVDLRSGRVRLLVHCSGCGGSPAWSPDGRLIAFAEGTKLEAIRPDGHGERTLFDGGSKLGGQVPAQISGPSWSPSGRSIAFHLLYDYGRPGTEESEVIVSRTGRMLRTLSCLPPSPPPFPPDLRAPSSYFSAERITWSPNGKWMAVSGGLDETRISVCRSDGSAGHWVTPGFEPDWQPSR